MAEAKGNKIDTNEIEKKWKEYWEKEGIYNFDPNKKGTIFSVDTPPPYASSGHLHVGHALHYTQFEIMVRAMRMMGYNVYFPPCYDDNGLPTEKFVQEKLGIDKSTTNRADFRQKCLEESRKVEKDYSERVFKALGHSYDWNLLYTTISPEAQKVSQNAFLKLVNQGDCYRKKEPVIWCPYHQTALAQADIEDEERKTKLNYLYFDLEDGGKIEIATTRPELLSACVGIFVNPNDERYKDMVGKNAIVPVFNDKVPIMEDESVDMEFGSGILMVCTFGDSADLDKWKRMELPLKVVINEDGTLNENAGKYKGKELKEAREEIVDELNETGYLIKQEELTQTVRTCERCNYPVEYLVKPQWFIKTLDYKEDLIKRGKEINWYPEFMRKRFEDWTNNLGWDWIISRQRFFGVPIPVWYCDDCGENILPEENELPIDPLETERNCPNCGKKARPEEDVFDTWMTSSNSPEIAGKWLENPENYEKVSPFSLRPQSQDIIRTWAFYTILKNHLLFNKAPWKDIMIGTFVLDEKGRGMSKSKGNVIHADELVERYGVDVFRYWVANAKVGSTLAFNEQELVAGDRFLKKLWNATKFVFMNLQDYNPYEQKPVELVETDKLFLNKLNETIEETTNNFNKYEYDKAKQSIEGFFWNMFTDNYLEIVKNRVYQGEEGSKEKLSAQYTLYKTLLAITKMFAPIMPFITEEIYQNYFHKDGEGAENDKSIHISKWPEPLDISEFSKEEETREENKFDLMLDVISKVRHSKSENQKSMKAPINLTLDKETKDKLSDFPEIIEDLKAVTNASEIKEGEETNIEFIE